MDIKIARPFSGSYPVTFKFCEDPDWYHNVFFEAHNGIDYGMPVGTPLLACDKETLLFADHLPDLDGRGIILNHSWGQSYYWHTSEELAKYGTEIEKGDPIGYSGANGFATGPHLHFGIRVNNPECENIRGFIDPEPYFEDAITTPQPPSPINKTYIVRPGNTLFGIARKFYRNGAEWRRIWDVNTEKIRNPNLIYPLQIPKTHNGFEATIYKSYVTVKQTVKKETILATYDQMRMRKNFSLGTTGVDPSDVMPSMIKLVQGTTDLDRVKDSEGISAKVGQFFFYGDKSILDSIEGYILNLAKVNDPYNNKDNGQPEKMYRVIGIFSDLLTPFVMYFRRGAINTVKNLLDNVFANLRGVYTFKIQIKTEQKKGEKGNYMTPVISIVDKENEPKILEILEKEARKYEYLSKLAGGEDFIDTKPAETLPASIDEPVDPTKPLKENVNPDDIPF